MEQSEIIERLELLKKVLHLSAAAIAQRSGLSESNFNKMLRGTQKITERTLLRISDAFGVSFDWLLEGKGDMLNPTTKVVTQTNEEGDNLTDSVKIVGGSDEWFAIIKKKDEQIDRLLTIIEKLQSSINK